MKKKTNGKQAILKRNMLPIILTLAVFILIDFIWLRLLPRLGISYGPRTFSAILFTVARIGILVLWLLLALLFRQLVNKLPLFPFWSFLIVNLLILAFGINGFCIEPFHLTQSHFEIQVPGLSHPARIIQLSDIHMEYTTKRERSLPDLIARLHPDMIVITGDLISDSNIGDPQTAADLRSLLEQLDAPLGIYIVNGNVETPSLLKTMLQGTGVHVLQNEIVRIPEFGSNFVLAGLSYWPQDFERQQLSALMSQTRPDDFSVLLYHTPDLIYTARDLHVDLYLAGHTHGGQVRIPFFGALFANSVYGKRFEMGLYHVDGTTLFVSRGLGFSGGIAPRIRFLSPPEVVVVDLIPEK